VAGHSIALATVTIFGLKFCWPACDQKVAKSGGGTTPVMIWQSAALKAAIWAVKSSDRI